MKKGNNEQKKQRLEFTVGKVHYVVNLVAAENTRESLEALILKMMERRSRTPDRVNTVAVEEQL